MNGIKDTLIIYLWDNSSFKFKKDNDLQIKIDGSIIAAAPGDIDYDGLLDLVVTYKLESQTKVQVWFQSSSGFTPGESWEVLTGSQPALLDIDGDRR